MADWIFQDSPRDHDLDARVTASPEQWWGTPRYRDRMAPGDRVWVQVTGRDDPGLYYVATITSGTYEHAVKPGDPAFARWRTDIRVDHRISPPLLRSELLNDPMLGSFRPFRGFQGSNVPVPPDIAAALADRAAARLVAPSRADG
ncbi:MAG TPA: EVE domain-containing protein [Streptosporangiaceae bacterium]|nr:EVE domain-containing protein [Streptosporangiaceae bacterium]